VPLNIVHGNLAAFRADALVNPSNSLLRGGGGVSGFLFKAAGWDDLQRACDAIGYCAPGQAVITPAFSLPARYVIHTVGPVYRGGGQNEAQLLRNAYINSLELARRHGLESIAFPLISSGTYGYPQAEAVSIAIRSIRTWLDGQEEEMTVTLVLFNRQEMSLEARLSMPVSRALRQAEYQNRDIRYSLRDPDRSSTPGRPGALRDAALTEHTIYQADLDMLRRVEEAAAREPAAEVSMQEAKPLSLSELIKQKDEGFSDTLLRLIDARGLTDAEVYKRANIDRKHFSKIRINPGYTPSKTTALALAIALKLTRDETDNLLARAGYALSPARTMDIIIAHFLDVGNYNIDDINAVLFSHEQGTLGV